MSMGLSIDSKVRELHTNPASIEVIEKFLPGFGKEKQFKLAYGFTFRAMAALPQSVKAGLTKEVVENIDEELRKL